MDIIPARKIKKSKTTVTGRMSSSKTMQAHDFESTLERDFILLQEFDYNVRSYVERPCTIEYIYNDVIHRYTPDLLIFYNPDSLPGKNFSPLLCEVKHSSLLERNAELNQVKFKAAEEYALKAAGDFYW